MMYHPYLYKFIVFKRLKPPSSVFFDLRNRFKDILQSVCVVSHKGTASMSTRHRCPLKQKAAVIGILGPLTPGLSHALLALQEEDGSKGSRVVERRGRP